MEGLLLHEINKTVTHKQGIDLAADREVEELLHGNAVVNMILHEPLITEKARRLPAEVKVYNRKLEGIAKLMKYWSCGDSRPENGCCVGFDFSYFKNASVVLPKYF